MSPSSYNPKLHHRRSIRLKAHDYAGGGLYFVTLCTKNRQPLFGTMQNGKSVLSEGGRVAEKCWQAIPEHFPNVEAGAFVAMPDHVHGIIRMHPAEGRKIFRPYGPGRARVARRERWVRWCAGSRWG